MAHKMREWLNDLFANFERAGRMATTFAKPPDAKAVRKAVQLARTSPDVYYMGGLFTDTSSDFIGAEACGILREESEENDCLPNIESIGDAVIVFGFDVGVHSVITLTFDGINLCETFFIMSRKRRWIVLQQQTDRASMYGSGLLAIGEERDSITRDVTELVGDFVTITRSGLRLLQRRAGFRYVNSEIEKRDKALAAGQMERAAYHAKREALGVRVVYVNQHEIIRPLPIEKGTGGGWTVAPHHRSAHWVTSKLGNRFWRSAAKIHGGVKGDKPIKLVRLANPIKKNGEGSSKVGR